MNYEAKLAKIKTALDGAVIHENNASQAPWTVGKQGELAVLFSPDKTHPIVCLTGTGPARPRTEANLLFIAHARSMSLITAQCLRMTIASLEKCVELACHPNSDARVRAEAEQTLETIVKHWPDLRVTAVAPGCEKDVHVGQLLNFEEAAKLVSHEPNGPLTVTANELAASTFFSPSRMTYAGVTFTRI